MKAFILAETVDGACALAAGARGLADEVLLLTIGKDVPTGVADRSFSLAIPEENIVEDCYPAVFELIDVEKPDLIMVEPTRCLKGLAGRIAARLGTAMITDVTMLDTEVAGNRYYGGVGERGYKVIGAIRVVSVDPAVFAEMPSSGSDDVTDIAFKAPTRYTEKLSTEALPVSGTNILKAERVICVGRGFADREDLELAFEFARKLDGEVGCTRPLTEGVDWMPKNSYIGVSGLSLNPRVYIGVGVSGQMQHMVGCSGATAIIAINKDKGAPIFKQADIGIVADLKEILPVLNAAW
ncbi:MAG: electron transfer flavoprotein subunit alpha/FixB family protein [Coriobacteriales bacterium]|jgi:electron transfer flavoprotein alpha subunit|nr:electron transfer flavoprotein subunit alpha/FixB family protein [Coriobacteriales bacterium]